MATPLVLIGPVYAGKTTILPLVAARLGLPGVDLDDVALGYYDEVGRGMDELEKMGAAHGFLGSYGWWQVGHVHAVRRVLQDYPGSVIAFGAGHSHYEDEEQFVEVADALAQSFVALVLPWRDLDRSIETCRARSIAGRGMDWRYGDVDVIANWVHSEQNHRLAAMVCYVEGRPPRDVADEVADAYRRAGG